MKEHRIKYWQKVVIMLIGVLGFIVVVSLGILFVLLGEILYAIRFIIIGIVTIPTIIIGGIYIYKVIFKHYDTYEVTEFLFNNILYQYEGENRSFDDAIAVFEEIEGYNYDNFPYSEIKITGITSKKELKTDAKYKIEMKTQKNGNVTEINITETDSK